jgi:hypothetical protein
MEHSFHTVFYLSEAMLRFIVSTEEKRIIPSLARKSSLKEIFLGDLYEDEEDNLGCG